MAKIEETEEQTVYSIQNNGQQVKLEKGNVFGFLKNMVDKGFRLSKTLTIKDGALLHRYFNILLGVEKSLKSDLSLKNIYDTILRAINAANSDGAFDTNDAAVIDKLTSFIDENCHHVTKEETTESVEL